MSVLHVLSDRSDTLRLDPFATQRVERRFLCGTLRSSYVGVLKDEEFDIDVIGCIEPPSGSVVRPRLVSSSEGLTAFSGAAIEEVNTTLSELMARFLEDAILGFKGTVGTWYLRANSIVTSLRRLKPGWAAEDSVAPSESACIDVETVSSYLPSDTQQPSVEVDESTGTIRLVWARDDNSSSFSLVFPGSGVAIGLLLTPESRRSWKHAASQESAIVRAIEDPAAHALLTGA